MTVHAITMEIDDAKLTGYADEFLAVCWHLAQHNPAEYGDAMAGELTERIGRRDPFHRPPRAELEPGGNTSSS
jgi:hypothetical protein